MSEPKAYLDYARSLPCGSWKQKEIEGMWNAAIEAAAIILDEHANNQHRVRYPRAVIAGEIRDLKI